MKIVDANVILRYLLDDIEEMVLKAEEIFASEQVYIPNEVIAEVVYVLEKVYKVSRSEISKVLINLVEYDNILLQDFAVVNKALETYASIKIDFVDAVLYAYKVIKNYSIVTFDKRLAKLLKSIDEVRKK